MKRSFSDNFSVDNINSYLFGSTSDTVSDPQSLYLDNNVLKSRVANGVDLTITGNALQQYNSLVGNTSSSPNFLTNQNQVSQGLFGGDNLYKGLGVLGMYGQYTNAKDNLAFKKKAFNENSERANAAFNSNALQYNNNATAYNNFNSNINKRRQALGKINSTFTPKQTIDYV